MKTKRFRPTSALHKEKAPKRLEFAVIICSTSRYSSIEKGEKVTDPTGELAVRLIKNSGHRVRIKKIVPDDKGTISKVVKDALSRKGVDVIITSGGTGIAPSDVTIEAVHPFLEKELLGFGELLRQLSYKEMGSSAMLTRALAGVAKGKAIFCLPGSPHAVELALKELILTESPHIVVHARGK